MPILGRPDSAKLMAKRPKSEDRKVVGRFKLLRGHHTEGQTDKGESIIYVKGDVFDSFSDLTLIDPQGHKFRPTGEVSRENHEFNVGYEPRYHQSANAANDEVLRRRAERKGRNAAYLQPPEDEDDEANPGTDEEEAAYERQALEGMTVDGLRELAEEESIDLGQAKRKDEIVQAILEARHSDG